MPKNPVVVVMALAPLGLAVLGFGPFGGLSAAAETGPYPRAVQFASHSAQAVLARAGRETCLRGKLTKALLGLSSSCDAAQMRSPLCRLADQAVVVTPMSLAFMDQTSHQLLDLIGAARGALPPAATSPTSFAPEPGVEP